MDDSTRSVSFKGPRLIRNFFGSKMNVEESGTNDHYNIKSTRSGDSLICMRAASSSTNRRGHNNTGHVSPRRISTSMLSDGTPIGTETPGGQRSPAAAATAAAAPSTIGEDYTNEDPESGASITHHGTDVMNATNTCSMLSPTKSTGGEATPPTATTNITTKVFQKSRCRTFRRAFFSCPCCKVFPTVQRFLEAACFHTKVFVFKCCGCKRNLQSTLWKKKHEAYFRSKNAVVPWGIDILLCVFSFAVGTYAFFGFVSAVTPEQHNFHDLVVEAMAAGLLLTILAWILNFFYLGKRREEYRRRVLVAGHSTSASWGRHEDENYDEVSKQGLYNHEKLIPEGVNTVNKVGKTTSSSSSRKKNVVEPNLLFSPDRGKLSTENMLKHRTTTGQNTTRLRQHGPSRYCTNHHSHDPRGQFDNTSNNERERALRRDSLSQDSEDLDEPVIDSGGQFSMTLCQNYRVGIVMAFIAVTFFFVYYKVHQGVWKLLNPTISSLLSLAEYTIIFFLVLTLLNFEEPLRKLYFTILLEVD